MSTSQDLSTEVQSFAEESYRMSKYYKARIVSHNKDRSISFSDVQKSCPSFKEESATQIQYVQYSISYNRQNITPEIRQCEKMFERLCGSVSLYTDNCSQYIRACKIDLACASDYFYHMFTNTDYIESQLSDIEIQEVDWHILMQLINSLYDSKIEICSDRVFPLLQAADRLQFLQIKEVCEEFIMDFLTSQEALESLQWLDMCNCSDRVKLQVLNKLAEQFKFSEHSRYLQNLTMCQLEQLLTYKDIRQKDNYSEYNLLMCVLDWNKTQQLDQEDLYDLLSRIVKPEKLTHKDSNLLLVNRNRIQYQGVQTFLLDYFLKNYSQQGLQTNSFEWTIQKYSHWEKTKKSIFSKILIFPQFPTVPWRLLIFPHGNKLEEAVSLYLGIYENVDSNGAQQVDFPQQQVRFSLTVVNKNNRHKSISKETSHKFTVKEHDWGYASMAQKDTLKAEDFLQDDNLLVRIELNE